MPLLQMEAITIQDNLHIKSLENYHTRLSWAGTGKKTTVPAQVNLQKRSASFEASSLSYLYLRITLPRQPLLFYHHGLYGNDLA